jgi:hypothetical protein
MIRNKINIEKECLFYKFLPNNFNFRKLTMEEVVVTGMGCVTPLGFNPIELWSNLMAENVWYF